MKLEDITGYAESILSQKYLSGILMAAFILVAGFLLARRASNAISRISHLDPQQRLLIQKLSYYGLITVVIATALSQLGFDLKVLLGAAGVLTVAVGFAAQTSASNLISGLFLIVDRPFVVGDIVEIGGVTGEVLSVDLLSSKIRTFDNILVRIPNETMVKSDIKNLTFFPIRRLDFKIGVSYKENIAKVHKVLLDVANRNPLCLEDPVPLFIFEGFGDSSLNIQFSVWVLRTNLLLLRNSILAEIKAAFDKEGIEIPYPHRTVILAGSAEPVTTIAGFNPHAGESSMSSRKDSPTRPG